MSGVLDDPALVFVTSFFTLWLATRVGASSIRRSRSLESDIREHFATILAATLTLSALIIGFTFSMAITRYDQRKDYEEAEANAIGTEYARADVLPAPDAATLRSLLREYLDQRVLFYTVRDRRQRVQIDQRTAQLQARLWKTVVSTAAPNPSPVGALVVSGMNDVLNSQGYTQAAWWNRIPRAAWLLMVSIAITGSVLLGYGAQDRRAETLLLAVVPFVVALSFLLIADIDSPLGGIVRVYPQNLASLAASMQ